MTEFPMHTRLFHDGLDLSAFYANDLGELADSIFCLLEFADETINDDLQYADVKTQLLGCFEGKIFVLFGSLQKLRTDLSKDCWEQLNMGICKLFYLQKVADWDAYASLIHELDGVLKNHELKERTANDE